MQTLTLSPKLVAPVYVFERSNHEARRVYHMTDITPLIAIVGPLIADFSIGFAKLSVIGREEDAAPAGKDWPNADT